MSTEKFIKDIRNRLAVQQLGIQMSKRFTLDSVDDGVNLTLTRRSNGESIRLPSNIPSINVSSSTL